MSERLERPPGGEAWAHAERADGLSAVYDADAFVGLDGPGALEVLADPSVHGAEVLKENPRRSVFRLIGAGPALVVKHYRERGLGDALKTFVGRSRARREAETAAAMLAAGLPVPAPRALARRRDGAHVAWSAFAMDEVVGAQPLGGFLEERFTAGDRRGVEKRPWLERAADVLAALHAAGFDHRDFHGGNLLVERASDAAPTRLLIVDLHRVARPGRVPTSRRVKALGDLVHTLRFAIDREDTRVVIDAYLTAARGEITEADRWVRLVERACVAREARRVKSRTRRCIRESSAFAPVSSGGVRGFRRSDVPLDQLFEAIARARHAIDSGGKEARSIARRSSVAVAACGERRVAVKVYPGDGRRSARGAVTRGRAGRAYVAAHGLFVRGVPVPPVVAWLRTPDRAFLIVDEVLDARPLSALSFRLATDPPALERVGDALVRTLGALISSGARVNDLSPKNVLVRVDESSAAAWLCDFDGIRFDGPMPRARLVRGLAQLNDLAPGVPIRARLRVLRRLAREFPDLAGGETAREIADGTAARAAKRLSVPAPTSVHGVVT